MPTYIAVVAFLEGNEEEHKMANERKHFIFKYELWDKAQLDEDETQKKERLCPKAVFLNRHVKNRLLVAKTFVIVL